MNKRAFGILGIFLCFLVPAVFAAELNVGKKVVYPGGADQPPKEKDVGVKLKVNPVSATTKSSGDANLDEDALDDLLKQGKTRELLKALADKTDPVSEGYKVLALQALNRKQEARKKAKDLIDSGECPDELKNRIEELFPPNYSPQH